LGGYGFSDEIIGPGNIRTSSRSCDLPGIYFRRFWRFDRNPPWTTLRISLWYPALLSATPPLLWIFRNRRRFTISERTQKFTSFICTFSPFFFGAYFLVVSIVCYFGLRHMYNDFDEHYSLPNYQVGILLHVLRLMFLFIFPASGGYRLLIGIWMRRLIKQKHELRSRPLDD
jgi:hypothetical protein